MNFSTSEFQELDFKLLSSGSINVYYEVRKLDKDIDWLKSRGYQIFVCELTSVHNFKETMKMLAKLLDLDSPFQGRSLDAFDELMFDRDVVCSTHEVLVFKPVSSHPKKFKKKWRALLSCLDSHAQRRMMLGKRFPILILDESEEFDLFNLKNRRVKSRFFPKEFLTAVELGD